MNCRQTIFWILGLALLSATPGRTEPPTASSAHAVATNETVYTLSECLVLGIERSIPLANARRDEEKADAQIGEIRSQVYPQLSANGQYMRLDEGAAPTSEGGAEGREDTWAASLQASQLLYSGGSVRAALDAAKSFRDITGHDLSHALESLIRTITQQFYDVLYAQAAVQVAQASVQQLEEFVSQSEDKFKQGLIAEFDYLSAEVSLANERPYLIAASNNLDLARSSFRNLLYMDSTNPLVLKGEFTFEPLTVDLSRLYELGLANRPELLGARANIDLLDADVRVTRGDYLPDVHAVASYTGTNPDGSEPSKDSWDWHWQAGVTASWSLLDGGLRSSGLTRKNLAKDQAWENLRDLKRSVKLEIQQAYLSLNAALEVVKGSRESVKLAERALDIAKVRYDQGLATYLEFTDSNLALRRAQLTNLAAIRDYLQGLANLKYACGTQDLSTNKLEEKPE